ncbi:NAD(P)H-binding protein (plasmid) [Rhizobium leguminosarum]|jgi:uncharacterized protein YbjT (DUF2867 family)
MTNLKRHYLVTCATGNVGRRAASELLKRGHDVRVFARNRDRLQPLIDIGATAVVGDMHDLGAVREAFQDIDAALLICKGSMNARDYRRDFFLAGENYAIAAGETGLRSAVFVSSLGAHDDRYRGLVLIHGDVEQRLNAVPGLNLLNLRSPMFFEDLFYFLPTMTTVGALTWPIAPDSLIDMGGTADVADVAVERLVALDFGGKQVVELHGQPGLTTTKIADIISGAIGRPFPVAPSSSEDDVARMMEAGIGRDFSILMNEAWETFSHGPVRESGRPGSRVLPQSIDRFIENVIAPAILAAPRAVAAE